MKYYYSVFHSHIFRIRIYEYTSFRLNIGTIVHRRLLDNKYICHYIFDKKGGKIMVTVLLILLGIYIVYRLLRPRGYGSGSYPAGGYGGSGMGSMFGGMILGYLLTHYLIDQNQYDMWRNFDDEQLRETLTSQGILNDVDYDQLAGQATAGTLPGYENNDDAMEWTNDNRNNTGTNDIDNYDDFGGGDDFGGFDS
jgi:hypothetical protein